MTSRDLCVGGLICGLVGLAGLACSAEGSGLPPPAASGTGGTVGGGSNVGGGMPMGGTAGGTAMGGTGGGVVSLTGGTSSTAGGTSSTTGGSTGTTNDGSSGIIPNDGGNFAKDWDVSGVIGSWYIYADSDDDKPGTSTITAAYQDPNGYGPFGNENGQFCFSGTTTGHHDVDYQTNWGVGIGVDVCAFPEDLSWLPADLQSAASPEQKFQASACPTKLTAVNSVTFTISGTWSGTGMNEIRVSFQESEAQEVAPFYKITSAGTYTVNASDCAVPDDWDVDNPGAVGSSNITALQWQISSLADDGTFDICISNVTIN
jgi:hypothetical protein